MFPSVSLVGVLWVAVTLPADAAYSIDDIVLMSVVVHPLFVS